MTFLLTAHCMKNRERIVDLNGALAAHIHIREIHIFCENRAALSGASVLEERQNFGLSCGRPVFESPVG